MSGLLLLSYDNFFILKFLPIVEQKALAWALRPHNETPGVGASPPPTPPPPTLSLNCPDGDKTSDRYFIFLGAGERHRLPQLTRFLMGLVILRALRAACCPHDLLLSGSSKFVSSSGAMIPGGLFVFVFFLAKSTPCPLMASPQATVGWTIIYISCCDTWSCRD